MKQLLVLTSLLSVVRIAYGQYVTSTCNATYTAPNVQGILNRLNVFRSMYGVSADHQSPMTLTSELTQIALNKMADLQYQCTSNAATLSYDWSMIGGVECCASVDGRHGCAEKARNVTSAVTGGTIGIGAVTGRGIFTDQTFEHLIVDLLKGNTTFQDFRYVWGAEFANDTIPATATAPDYIGLAVNGSRLVIVTSSATESENTPCAINNNPTATEFPIDSHAASKTVGGAVLAGVVGFLFTR